MWGHGDVPLFRGTFLLKRAELLVSQGCHQIREIRGFRENQGISFSVKEIRGK